MTKATIIKMAGLATLLLVAAFVFGSVSARVYTEHINALFSPERLLDVGAWLFLAMGLMAITAALVATLVKPMRVCALAFAASALALIVGAGVSLVTLSFGVVYFAATLWYAHAVTEGVGNRLTFSVEPIERSQGVLLFALIFLTSLSLYRGFAEDMAHGGYVLPTAYKKFAFDLVEPRLRAEIDAKPLKPEERARALNQARAEIEGFFKSAEDALTPYAVAIPAVIGFLVFWWLETMMGLLSWLLTLALRGIFALLQIVGVTQVITETRQVKRLMLA